MYARSALAGGLLLTLGLLLAAGGLAQAEQMPLTPADPTLLVINELMASNSQTLEDPQEPGEYPDWFEIYNPSSSPVSLDGLVLKRGDAPDEETFAITDGLTIPARGFLVFFADSDPKQGPLHTNFRLSKAGDFLSLYGAGGAVEIDSRRFQEQVTDVSEGRDPDGGAAWRVLDRPTPGRPNRASPPLITNVRHAPELPGPDDPVIVSAEIVDDGAVAAATVVYTADVGGPASVPMTAGPGSSYTAQIPPQPAGVLVSYYVQATDDDGELTPDPAVDPIRPRRYLVGYVKPSVVINEVLAENNGLLEDADDPGDFPDLIELYNPGQISVSLNGLFLTDEEANPTRFAITDGLTIAAGGRLLFYADDDSEQGALHTNFKLNKDGEMVALYGAFGAVELDRIEIDTAFAIGRFPDGAAGEHRVLYCATPGAPNLLCDRRSFLPAVAQ